jgi:hypothetical protein
MPKRVSVTSESASGRDLTYHDNYTGQDLSRAKFVQAIEAGEYSKYHVRNINGVKTPVSNPDSSTNNNLG